MSRILDGTTIGSLRTAIERGRMAGLEQARRLSPDEIISTIDASGLRGRGGGGFPTGTKWRTVAEMSAATPATVVVNGAEGEPGSFKDRAILRHDPYQVLEGALIAAVAVDSSRVVVAIKESFERERRRLTVAIDELKSNGLDDVEIEVVEGPGAYLFGEESALLEVIDGRPPFPRVTPPYRRGVGEGDRNAAAEAELSSDTGDLGSPALVNNVETFAHVAAIFRDGVEAFRSVGTEATPGTTVCTISGATRHAGVGEFPMGTPLWDVLDELGGGPREERTLIAAISGTANSAITADLFDTPLCFDAFADAGSGLGASGFIVFDDETDLVSAAHDVARFLAVESCGQCTPCKRDGTEISRRLMRARRREDGPASAHINIGPLLRDVATGARCGLAAQHQSAVASLYDLARSGAVHRDAGGSDELLIAPIVDFVDGDAVLQQSHGDKQTDWSFDERASGKDPAERLVSVGAPRREP